MFETKSSIFFFWPGISSVRESGFEGTRWKSAAKKRTERV